MSSSLKRAVGIGGLRPVGDAMLAQALPRAVQLALHRADQLNVGERIDRAVDLVEGGQEPRPEAVGVDIGRRRLAQEVRIAVADDVNQAVLLVEDLPDQAAIAVAVVDLRIVIVAAGRPRRARALVVGAGVGAFVAGVDFC